MINNRRRRLPLVIPHQDDHRLRTSWFQPTDETMKEQESILSNTYFLVKQGNEFGERLKCTVCGRRHDYITLMCVEKPISGLANGLYAYYRALKDAHVETELKPAQLTRLNEIYEVLQRMPDLSKVHPQLARKVVQDIGPSDLQIGAVSLGILEGISPTEARSLVERINYTGIRPSYTLNPVSQAEIDRALAYRGPQFTRSRW